MNGEGTVTSHTFHWRSVRYASGYYKRSIRHIRRMCSMGTFCAANIPVYRDLTGRWWICIPSSEDPTELEGDTSTLTG